MIPRCVRGWQPGRRAFPNFELDASLVDIPNLSGAREHSRVRMDLEAAELACPHDVSGRVRSLHAEPPRAHVDNAASCKHVVVEPYLDEPRGRQTRVATALRAVTRGARRLFLWDPRWRPVSHNPSQVPARRRPGSSTTSKASASRKVLAERDLRTEGLRAGRQPDSGAHSDMPNRVRGSAPWHGRRPRLETNVPFITRCAGGAGWRPSCWP